MTAKEMFEELGYKLEQDNGKIIRYTLKIFAGTEVVFDVYRKHYYVSVIGRSLYVDVNLHNAIHQQLKELEWIE